MMCQICFKIIREWEGIIKNKTSPELLIIETRIGVYGSSL